LRLARRRTLSLAIPKMIIGSSPIYEETSYVRRGYQRVCKADHP
jgi:hypothetical protein